jgi:hypothetical protein
MVGNNADGTFTQPPPKPMPDMGTDVAPAAPDAPAAAARDRIKRNLGSQSGALDVSILADIVDYGRSLYRAGMDAAVWTANMIKEFGERIRPLLKQAFDQVRSAYQASRFSDTTGAVNVTPMNKPKAAAAGAPFYMKSAQVLDSKIQGKAATADQVRAILKNPQNGIKAEELKWTGIEQAVERIAKENGGKVPKEALLRYLQEDGAVRLEEVAYGQAARDKRMRDQARADLVSNGVQNPTEAQITQRLDEFWTEYDDGGRNIGGERYGQYQLPGGENYREVVLAMPAETAVKNFTANIDPSPDTAPQSGKYVIMDPDGRVIQRGYANLYAAQTAAERMRNTQNYYSNHFPDTPNYVAHARLNERADAAGRAGLFLEEIQSDRHQAGRTKGYRGEGSFTVRKSTDGAGFEAYSASGEYISGTYKSTEAASRAAAESLIDTVAAIPDAPFRKDWPVQMFKRALADAVENGKEWIGWTTGETQAARYDLSKQVESVAWDDKLNMLYVTTKEGVQQDVPNATPQKLPDIIGKEAADRLVKAAPDDDTGYRMLEGVDLKVGGEGMKGFYDQILPKEISKYVKQWGGQVEKSRVGTKSSKRVDDLSDMELVQELERTSDTTPIWRVNITPQMRESIKKAGQALFVGGVAAVVADEELR